MPEQSTPETEGDPHTSRVGRRLAIVREELGRYHGEVEWSQTAVANKTGLSQGIISRIERGAGGQIESWLLVLGLYEQQGYNLNWILTEDNQLLSKLQMAPPVVDSSEVLRQSLLQKLGEHEQAFGSVISDLRSLLLNKGN